MSIKIARAKAGKTQADIAKEVGVTVAAVSLWENGTTMPRAATLNKLARFLGCTVDDLLREDST